jgi:2-phosphoglycerate kinase
MIIWINGAFGVGKSHTSAELVRRLDNTFLFDPEKVGFFLRKHLPNMN